MPTRFFANAAARYGVMSLLLAMILSGCVAPTGPTEVRRFHAISDVSAATSGRIAVVPAPGYNGGDLEFRVYAQAVEDSLAALGYTVVDAGSQPDQLATLNYNSQIRATGSGRGPVSVGVGGGRGGFRSGIGGGVGFNLGGGSRERVLAEMQVVILSADGTRLWEGEALGEAKPGTPEAEVRAVAAKLADALFVDFPGESGETYEVE